jgi:hypothetical protein
MSPANYLVSFILLCGSAMMAVFNFTHGYLYWAAFWVTLFIWILAVPDPDKEK